MDSGLFVKEFKERFAAVVANGQGDMKGKLFRIAHIGYYDYIDTIGVIGALEHVVAKLLKPRHVEFGAAVKAAQLVYAQRMAEQSATA
jgi:aspartate aminotransferase-like enzyme